MTPCLAATTGTRRKPTCLRRQHRQRSTTESLGYASQGSAAISRAPPIRARLSAVDTIARALKADRVVELAGAEQARSAAYLITMVEGGALHLARLRERAAGFRSRGSRPASSLATMIPGAWVAQAQKFRRQFHATTLALFRDVDILLAPATPCRAPRLEQKTFVLDGREMLVRPNIGLFTQPISFIGLPVVAAPVWTEGEKLPIGVQIIAAPWREDLALRVAWALEQDGVVRAPVAKLS